MVFGLLLLEKMRQQASVLNGQSVQGRHLIALQVLNESTHAQNSAEHIFLALEHQCSQFKDGRTASVTLARQLSASSQFCINSSKAAIGS